MTITRGDNGSDNHDLASSGGNNPEVENDGAGDNGGSDNHEIASCR